MTAGNRTGVVLALGAAQTLAWGSTYYLPAILAGPMARDLGMTTTGVFAAFSLALVVAALLGPFAGRRIDRAGGRDVLALSNLLFAAGLGAMAAAQGPATLAASWALVGVGMALGLYEAAFATLAAAFGRDARGPITGVTLMAGFASTICWPLTAWFEVELGWRGACLLWAGAHLALGLPLNRLLVPTGTQPPPPPPPPGAPPPPDMLLPMATLAFVFAVTWIVSTAMAAHLPTLLQAAGATPAAALAAGALVGPAQVAARLTEFGLMRRMHPLTSARIAAAAHPVAVAALLALGGPAAAAFAVLHGAGNGLLTIAKGTLPLVLFGPVGYGLRQGLLMAPARFGSAAAPWAFAWLIERHGVGAFAVTGALGLAGFVALMLLSTTAAPRSARG